MAISAGVSNDHLYVEVKMKEQPSFKPCSGKAALDSSINNITAESEDQSSINQAESDDEEDTGSQFEVIQTNGIMVIQADIGNEIEINAIQGESNLPLRWDNTMEVGHISDAKLMTNKPAQGMNYTLGRTSYTFVLFQGKRSQSPPGYRSILFLHKY
jgi:hypothetical protein